MRKKWLTLFIITSFVFSVSVKPQSMETYNLFLRFTEYYNSGDLINAEKCMLSVLESKDDLSETYLVAAYNNLGATYTLWGRYNEALEYYNLAEAQIYERQQSSQTLADIYNNKSRIYTYQRSFPKAIEYLEKSARIYLSKNKMDYENAQRISTVYLNIGIAYYDIKEYQIALGYLNKSAEIKKKFKLPRAGLVYCSIADCYVKTEDPDRAEEFFKQGIKSLNKEYGQDYFRMADLYFDYGQFLGSEGRDSEALEILQKALSICVNSYGEKNTLVSLAYEHLGDFFLNQKDYNSALIYYQKALVAIVNDFNDDDIQSNPSIQSSLYDIRLLDILKSKSEAFELLAIQNESQESQIEMMKKSYETIDLALQLIQRMRSNYLNEESRLYLAENEKETYIHATNVADYMFSFTGDPGYKKIMFNIAQQAKAAVLRSEITGNELLYTIGIPDSLRQKYHSLFVSIDSYNNLMREELQKPDPDTQKTDLWKDALFGMKNDLEKTENRINDQFPQYRELLEKTEPVSLEEIQRELSKDESLIDYLLSNRYISGKRILYIFTVTKHTLNFHKANLDSLFTENVETIREGTVQTQNQNTSLNSYINYTRSLYNMYDELIRPVEHTFAGKKLIIVPDEEIAYLSFDAFLKSRPDSNRINYEELDYLIKNYTFSYGYSSSLVFNREMIPNKMPEVYSFSPDYNNSYSISGSNGPDYLSGAAREVGSIFRWFPGKEYLGDQATETNFKSVIRYPAIFHLALHSMVDRDNSRYSSLLFDVENDTSDDGKLYNYEISSSRISSPMVVLSACNTGSGTLSRGEGVMSLTRGFLLAGASSVVKTFWDVNDDASAKIITDFYFHLSRGMAKDKSLRLAKLDYLKSSPPAYINPWYWAAYSVTGNTEPVTKSNKTGLFVVSGLILVPVTVFLYLYFRRRRRFFALF